MLDYSLFVFTFVAQRYYKLVNQQREMLKNVCKYTKKSLRNSVPRIWHWFRRLVVRYCNCLLTALGVATHELIDTSGGIDELALTSVEGV